MADRGCLENSSRATDRGFESYLFRHFLPSIQKTMYLYTPIRTGVAMIGILAGMGPKSTGPFVDQVVASFQSLTGAKNDIDFPPMMIYSLPTPFYIDRPIDHKLMEKIICEGLKKLEACGATFVAMPCNTAHFYFFQLQHCVQVPLLNMVNVTLQQVPRSAKKITVLATRQTLESKIYQKGLESARLDYMIDSDCQGMVDEMILSIKSSSSFEKAINLWKELSNKFRKAEVDTILLACTDLNPVLKTMPYSFQVVDSSLCLAEAIVRKWEEQRQSKPFC